MIKLFSLIFRKTILLTHILFFSALILINTSETKGQSVNVCNLGDVDVYVAFMRLQEYAGSQFYAIDGWFDIAPKGTSCPRILGGFDGFYYFVFAVKDPQNKYVAVKYELSNVNWVAPEQYRIQELCVKPDGFDFGLDNSIEKRDLFVPPCQAGFFKAPVSGSVYMEGDVGLKLKLTPTANDYKNGIPLKDPDKVLPATSKPVPPKGNVKRKGN